MICHGTQINRSYSSLYSVGMLHCLLTLFLNSLGCLRWRGLRIQCSSVWALTANQLAIAQDDCWHHVRPGRMGPTCDLREAVSIHLVMKLEAVAIQRPLHADAMLSLLANKDHWTKKTVNAYSMKTVNAYPHHCNLPGLVKGPALRCLGTLGRTMKKLVLLAVASGTFEVRILVDLQTSLRPSP